MPPPTTSERDQTHRFPGESRSHGVGLSSRCTLSAREGQERLFEGGITVSHAALRPWWRPLGQDVAHRRRRRRPQPGEPGAWDAGFGPLHGAHHSLWRAGDQADTSLALLGGGAISQRHS
jgi:transposase-like protein